MDFNQFSKSPSLGIFNLNHVPSYAKDAAKKSIQIVKDLEDNHLFKPGLYYIVLVDLVGSTHASSVLGPEVNKDRIEKFIKSTIVALTKVKLHNYAQFIKEIGDASLFLFNNFEDVLNWAGEVDREHRTINEIYTLLKKPAVYKMYCKKCVHVGEVTFSDISNPLALAINQVFKIEKSFKKNQIGITDQVRQIIVPRIASGELKAKCISEVTLPGEESPSKLWVVSRKTQV